MTSSEPNLLDAITFDCVGCGQKVSICSSCWRGQRYCGVICSQKARIEQKRKAQKKYSSSEKGLESGRTRQQRRYEKIKSLKSSH